MTTDVRMDVRMSPGNESETGCTAANACNTLPSTSQLIKVLMEQVQRAISTNYVHHKIKLQVCIPGLDNENIFHFFIIYSISASLTHFHPMR